MCCIYEYQDDGSGTLSWVLVNDVCINDCPSAPQEPPSTDLAEGDQHVEGCPEAPGGFHGRAKRVMFAIGGVRVEIKRDGTVYLKRKDRPPQRFEKLEINQTNGTVRLKVHGHKKGKAPKKKKK